MPAAPIDTTVLDQQISSSDLSGRLIESLFGPNWDSLSQLVLGSGEPTPSATLLLAILSTLSTVALMIGTVIMIYTVFIGVIGTAHEGTPLGKRLSTLWTPIRGALSVALLIPTSKGLSVLMVLLLVLIGQSINLANHVWAAGINYLRSNSGQVIAQIPAGERQAIENVARSVLQSLAAQHHLSMRAGLRIGEVYKVIEPTEADHHWTIIFQPPPEASADPLAMGSVIIPCAGPTPDAICTARKNGILNMTRALMPVAEAIIADNMSDEEIAFSSLRPRQPIDRGVATAAMQAYLQSIQAVIPQIVDKEKAEHNQGLNRFLDQAGLDGWISAGSYYWTFARYAEMTHKATGGLPQATSPNPDLLKWAALDDPQFYAALHNAEDMINKSSLDQSIEAAKETPKTPTGMMRHAKKLMYELFGIGTVQRIQDGGIGLAARQLTEGDPIAALASWGTGLQVNISSAYAAYVITRAGAAGGDAAAQGIIAETFTGGLAGGFTAGVLEAIKILSGPILGLMGLLLIASFTLSYYLPALPWILWTGAIIGWLILVVESLCAAPFWAVGIMVPEGEGMTGQHGRQGVMLLLGILARPVLMLMGFFAAMVIMKVIGQFIGSSFLIFYGSATTDRLPSIFALAAHTVILTGVLVVSSHKIFGLITYLPENVIRWIGGGQSSLGESNDEARTRAIFAAGLRPGGMAAGAGGFGGLGKGKASEKPDPKQEGGQGNQISSDTKNLSTD